MVIVSVTMEVALDEIPIFAGGLGVLEGDKFYAMSRTRTDYLVITLFHTKGYIDYEVKEQEVIRRPQDYFAKLVDKVLVPERELIVKSSLLGEIRFRPLSYSKELAKVVYLKVEEPELAVKASEGLYISDDYFQTLLKYLVLGKGASGYIKERVGEENVEFVDLQESHSGLTALDLKERGKVRLIIHTPGPWGHPSVPREFMEKEYSISEEGSLTKIIMKRVGKVITVSKLHMDSTIRVFGMGEKTLYIRNGVDLERWTHGEIKRVVARKGEIGIEEFKKVRGKMRGEMESYIRAHKAVNLNKETMIISWARRLTLYKRPYFVTRFIEEVGRELNAVFVLGGKAHPDDKVGMSFMKRFHELEKKVNNVIYIYDYDLPDAKVVLSSSDLLLFTPFPRWEACGTSYMKAGINGVLTLSSMDGGAIEVIEDDVNGFLFGRVLGEFINIYENEGKVKEIDEEDYREFKSKLIKIYERFEGDKEGFLEKGLRALMTFRKECSMENALKKYYTHLHFDM